MSVSQSEWKDVFVPPAYDTQHIVRRFDEIIAEVTDVVAPVWPLQDYVAVNPYAGISHRSFMDARSFMKVFSDCETLMPLAYYAAQYCQRRFSLDDIQSAIEELGTMGISHSFSASEIAKSLNTMGPAGTNMEQPSSGTKRKRATRTLAEHASTANSIDWAEAIVDEISKHLSAHYDEGQSTWSSPHAGLPLFQAWRSSASQDLNLEILGLTGFREFVAGLPHTAPETITVLLDQLKVPESLWSTFLLCQAFSIPGWCAWTKYKSSWEGDQSEERNDLIDLLAIRLAYDAAIGQAESLSVNWSALADIDSTSSFRTGSSSASEDALLRYLLLRASEIGYRSELIGSLRVDECETSDFPTNRKLAQMVFCIDVRSERIRRNLESACGHLETFGFAGFFGMPIEYVSLGERSGKSQLPVLLKPQFKLFEGLHESLASVESDTVDRRMKKRSWEKLWDVFQASAIGCFSFVETLGLFYGVKLLRRSLGLQAQGSDAQLDGLPPEHAERIGSTMRGLNQQGLTTSHQADLAESMLRNLGLTQEFGRFVVLCGHACQTDNNPLAAGLDCGACGGHSGEPNARFAAMLLNQPYIRSVLAERGIEIRNDTHFLAAVHNTTTDEIQFFDTQDVPAGHRVELEKLQEYCQSATEKTQLERLPVLASDSVSGLLNRAKDWSEVRPEWGLAGNAAFVVAPRAVTKHANLDARSFLHSYDHRRDPDGSVLEGIMTAPMVVAHWINMQYYASTVDNRHFGSGNKTVHNVVGQFGILSGNGGDLMTGLPWQSLHNGDEYQHLPMRLQVVIAAPRETIERVIEKHELLSNLLTGGWLHLIAIDEGEFHQFVDEGTWKPIPQAEGKHRLHAKPFARSSSFQNEMAK